MKICVKQFPTPAMKRGKRQVIQPQEGLRKTQQTSSDLHSNYFQTLSSSMPNAQIGDQSESQRAVHQTPKVLTQSFSQSRPTVDDADQKKRKIQLLKQKYLKKSKPQETKPQSQILQNQSLPIQQTVPQTKSISTENQQKPQLKIQQPKPQISFPKPAKIQNLIQSLQTKMQAKYEVKPISVSEENKNRIEQQKLNQKPEQKTSEINIHQDVPKPPSRIPGRNAPPPPPIKKNSQPPPPIPVRQNVEPTNLPKRETEQELNTKTVPLPVKQQIIQQQVELSNKTQKQDITSFAPPSLSTNEINKTQKKVGSLIPPPPNRNMKQILNKKLTNKPVPKPPSRTQQQSVDNNELDEQTAYNHPNSNQNIPINGMSKKVQPVEPKNIDIDDEYNNPLSTNNYQNQVNKVNTIEKVDPLKFVGQWLGSPELTLKQLFPELKQAIEYYCLNKNLTLQIISNNPGFTPLIAEFVQAFIINNSTKYTEDQKKVAQSICLNFFYSNAAQFSDIFLILLVKIGEGYLQKYQKALQDRLQKYLSKILFYKNLFLLEEIDSFINFCLEKNLVRQINFLQFLMLSENAQLLTLINNTEIQNLKYTLAVLSFCKLNLKNKNLMGLYLKLISNIQAQLARNGLIQKILNHLKELDIPQNLYQYSKQLKLRLLKNYENKSQLQNNYTTKVETNIQSNTNQTNKQSGLFGYFNLNKAIDKIKTSTEKALGAVQKPKKPQEQEKKDQIVYDPVRKRYIINGQIPDDDDSPQTEVSTQVKSKVPPPPPIGGVRKAPPPMHNKKPGPRIAVNRYA